MARFKCKVCKTPIDRLWGSENCENCDEVIKEIDFKFMFRLFLQVLKKR